VAHRKVNKREPKPKCFRRPPKPPEDLDDDTKKEWQALAKILTDMRVLTAADLPALEQFAFEQGLLRQIRKDLLTEGYSYETKKSGVQHFTQSFKALAMLGPSVDKACKAFGMVPSARVGLRTEEPKTAGDPTDDWSDF
jgi:P27 family predicted phage terminase small subunit